MQNKNIRIRWQRVLAFCVMLLCCGSAGSAELLGSVDPEIKKNFNQLLVSNTCKGCNLRGAILNRLNLAKADLEGADLSGARLNGASLIGANLRNAVLCGAQLGGTDLTNANLFGANMEGADFSSAGRATENPGQQAADATLQAVNKAIDDLFARQPQPGQAELTTQLDYDISVLAAPSGTPTNASSATQVQRNVDEIPVIEHETLLLEIGAEQGSVLNPLIDYVLSEYSCSDIK